MVGKARIYQTVIKNLALASQIIFLGTSPSPDLIEPANSHRALLRIDIRLSSSSINMQNRTTLPAFLTLDTVDLVWMKTKTVLCATLVSGLKLAVDKLTCHALRLALEARIIMVAWESV